MGVATASARLAPLRLLLQHNTRLFRACLLGMDDDTARRRIGLRTNNVAYLAAHLLETRLFVARRVGAEPEPAVTRLSLAGSIDDMVVFPPVTQLRAGWEAVDAALDTRLVALTDRQLDLPSLLQLPVSDGTLFGALAWMAQHESYHIGQMAFLRQQLGLEPVRYG